jgi:hypothetical protein
MKKDLSSIEASLTYGQLFTDWKAKLLWIGLIPSLLLPIVLLIIVILTFTGEIEWNDLFPLGLILGILLSFSCIGTFLYLLLYNNKLKKEVLACLEDAVELTAITRSNILYPLRFTEGVKLEVIFHLNKKAYRKTSGIPKKTLFSKEYQKIYRKYANRKISILYSPSHDEVLILKD